MSVKAIPEGFNSVSCYLIVKDAEKALEFYQKAFGGKQGAVMRMPDGSIMHAEVCIGNSTVMLTSENPQWNMKSAETLGASPVSMHIYTENADAAFQQAMDAGCEVEQPLMDAFWGDRYGKLRDPFGISWGIATHTEDLNEQEMGERAQAFFAEIAQQGGAACE